MKKNHVSVVIAVLLIALMLFAVNSAMAKDTLIIATNAGPDDLNPHGITDQNAYDVRLQIYEGLVFVDANGGVQPLLATEWQWEDDQTINFTLRDGVTFQNGSEFTATDVLYSLKHAAGSSYTASYLENVDLEASSVLEDGRIQLKLTSPMGAILSRLSLVMMIDAETWEAEGEEKMLENPVGTGPYMLTNFVAGDRLEFTAYEGYWGGVPYFKNLVMRIIPESSSRSLEIEAGTVDISLSVQASDVEVLEGNPDVKLLSTPSYMITYLGFDATQAPYDNKLVRQALSYALDRDSICEVVYSGLGTPANYGRLSEVYWGYTEEGMTDYSYNPEKAKELLAEAGYPDGFDMTLTLSEAEQDQIDMSEIIQNQLAEIGINVTIDIMENGSFLNLIVDGGFDAFLLNSVGSSADPGEATKSFISTRPTWSNTTRYVNPALDELIYKGQQTVDEAEKLAIFTEVQQIISDECPWVFLVHNRIAFAVRSDIEGMVAYPSVFHYYKEAYMN